jgi:hypothetical protein
MISEIIINLDEAADIVSDKVVKYKEGKIVYLKFTLDISHPIFLLYGVPIVSFEDDEVQFFIDNYTVVIPSEDNEDYEATFEVTPRRPSFQPQSHTR